ncbi:hypothetical protein WJX82_006946 [Trebouxia sp. C0006]
MQEPLPSIARVYDAVLTLQACAGSVSGSAITDSQLSSCNFLLDKNWGRGLQIVDQGGVRCFEAESSKRRVFQVQGKSASDHYLVFPEHYCSCQAFFFEVVGRSEAPFCKHQIAAKIADTYKRCPVTVLRKATLDANETKRKALMEPPKKVNCTYEWSNLPGTKLSPYNAANKLVSRTNSWSQLLGESGAEKAAV